MWALTYGAYKAYSINVLLPMPNHYHQPNLLETILARLEAEGIAQDQLTREQLSMMDEFHLQGAKVSVELAERAGLYPGMKVLDVGCGIGGPCRMLADEFGCEVTGIDFTAEYIRTAKALTRLVGLDKKITFLEGSALDLPFEPASFDLVWTQHAQMNIADKAAFFRQIQRVLKKGGRFVYYDIFGASTAGIHFPVPWAEQPESSHLMAHDEIAGHFDPAFWKLAFHQDHTISSKEALKKMLEKIEKGEGPKLGLNLLMQGSTFEKLSNLWRCLEENRVAVHAGIFESVS